jgi:hypothetical protein
LVKERLKTLSPLNTDNTTNKAMAPTIIPILAIRLMILIALFLLLEYSVWLCIKGNSNFIEICVCLEGLCCQ